jgi:hypothetical protein
MKKSYNFLIMEESPLIRLDLRAPLVYIRAPDLEPFVYTNAANRSGEILFCFELDPEQSRGIEPDPDRLLGPLIFAGIADPDRTLPAPDSAETARLPAGLYLFIQKREVLNREGCIDLAVEQQKDGLWERLKPENRLYVRYLFEDSSPVTQLFRPYRP